MFGMGIFEILVILIVAVIFLGPEKLPQAIIDIVKFFKAVKKTLNDAKDTFDKELHMSEIKKEALEYKSNFENSIDSMTKDIQLKEIDDMFGKYKEENNPKKPIKTPKIPAPDAALSYEENQPKKRGRKPKNEQSSDESLVVSEKKSTKTATKKASKPPKETDTFQKRVITPKSTKSVGFKKSKKTDKGDE
ncbi:twin arginine-targeting protein translocase TatB [Helicobacter sp. 13S00482-2]|uniref:Sec-independent protein translocase protein TatB n=1 Tax=Helicobacter sp. 13S00482-2 TaxID=1476200 RepID=UPI000BA55C8A|nr:Sec-independent protein translocase protein TatB [Helicobacter sp. 13S00482-2]PAF53285.1 twin arginine-targeting protein translocase TatB [Helicobacter sp. 13S00482-2]